MRIVTFNVHGCLGLDFQRSEARVAERIGRLAPDLVALQELDMGRARSQGRHQADLIAAQLNLQSYFHPAMRWADEHYGNAVLSRWPMQLRRADELPSQNAFLFREARAAMWVEIATPSGPLHIINAHLGVGPRERREQTQALAGVDWMGAIPGDEAVLLLGDLNSTPGSVPHGVLGQSCDDLVNKFLGGHAKTFPSLWPLLTLDHVFGNVRIEVTSVEVPGEWRDAVVSDHLPVVVDFEIRRPVVSTFAR